MTATRDPGWRSVRLKHTSTLKGRLGWQGLKAEEYQDEGPFVVSSAHFRNERIAWGLCPRVSWERYRLDTNIQLSEGDVLIMKDGAALGKLAYVDQLPGPACLNSHVLLFRPRGHSYEPRFLYYYMGTTLFQDYILVRGTGATFLGVSQETIGDHELRLPRIETQRALASFLDRKTAAIDALIAKKERLIELLQEKRQALITQAVTKGLDPNVPMKESGVECLGRVPLHWTVQELRHRITRVEQGWSPSCENREADEGEWGVLKVGCVNYGTFRFTENKALPADLEPLPELEVRQGDVLISRANTRELVGSAAFVEQTQTRLLLCDKLFRLYCRSGTTPRVLVLLLQSAVCRFQMESEATGASGSMQNIGQDSVRRLIFAWAPEAEQPQIVAAVAQATQDITRLCVAVSAQIDKLREYRQALITAAVTGKIDVSKEAA